MKTLIIKLNAMGDVVRTTSLLNVLEGDITWISESANLQLLSRLPVSIRALPWTDRANALDTKYDLLINLEDEPEVATFAESVSHSRLFGAHLGGASEVTYTSDAQEWFDMSLISRFGRAKADQLKLLNRRTYQDLVFEGLGYRFAGERYLLPAATPTDLEGDVAIAPVAGPVWPMKNWAHYDSLRLRLEADGLKVNVLPRRASILEHIGDIKNHRCLVAGDSLPMHIALGTGTPCVTIFNCTSPWEIYDYGLMSKIVSPLLDEFFYKRGLDPRATTAVQLDDVVGAVLAALGPPAH